MKTRREFLQTMVAASAAAGMAAPAFANDGDNCALPATLSDSERELIAAAWDGVDPQRLWDVHTHVVGIGAGGTGAYVNPQTESWLSPIERARRLMFLSASCISDDPQTTLDSRYVARLLQLISQLPRGYKMLLFAFDHVIDDQGVEQAQRSTFHVPNTYASALAQTHPEQFEWVASIHPYRADAVQRLNDAVAAGARGVKWLPSSMNINPGSPRCDAFYRALAQHRLPLIIHCGEELAAPGARAEAFNNPLLVRRPLEEGVRVVVAHASSLWNANDFEAIASRDPAEGPRVRAFDLFTRLMEDRNYAGNLFADISSVTARNRDLDIVQALLTRQHWHARLLHGTDYPVPGIRLAFSTSRYVDADMLSPAAAHLLDRLQRHNPLLFDFVLKRALRQGTAHFGAEVFHTREFFLRKTA